MSLHLFTFLRIHITDCCKKFSSKRYFGPTFKIVWSEILRTVRTSMSIPITGQQKGASNIAALVYVQFQQWALILEHLVGSCEMLSARIEDLL